jgi:uncharacterized protein (TIGR02266 family)
MSKPASIRAKLKFPSVDVFIDRYSPNISKAGIFVKTPKPKPVGTTVRFEFQIADGTVVMRGAGEVSWIRESSDDGKPTGMGIKFNKLDSKSREILGRILDNKKSLPSEESRSKYSDAPPLPPADMDADEIQPEEISAEVEAAPQVEPEPEKKETGSAKRSKRKRKLRSTGLDMGTIDNLLADISSDSAPRKRRRRKAKPEVPVRETEPIEEAAPEPVDEEPVDEEPVDEEPVDEEPVDEEPVDEEIVSAALEPEREEENGIVLDDEEEAVLAALGSFDDQPDDIETTLKVEDEPEEEAPAFTFSEPPMDPSTQPEVTSFLDEEMDEDLDETLEIGEETLSEDRIDNEVVSVSSVDDDLILGADEFDEKDALETLDETDTGLIGDTIDTLLDEINLDSAPPASVKPLLAGESIDDALGDFFTGEGSEPGGDGARISIPPSPGAPDELPSGAVPDGLVRERPVQPPETLPDDAIPAGLVRERPERQPPPIKDIYSSEGRDPTGASVSVPESIVPGEADDEKKKKGFFKKLFSK